MSQLGTMLTDDAQRPAIMAVFETLILYFIVYMNDIKNRKLEEIPRDSQKDLSKLNDKIEKIL